MAQKFGDAGGKSPMVVTQEISDFPSEALETGRCSEPHFYLPHSGRRVLQGICPLLTQCAFLLPTSWKY